jgi:hypothetical protein
MTVMHCTNMDLSILGIQLTTDVFVELHDDGLVRAEICSSH